MADGAYLMASGYIEGAVKFSSAALLGTLHLPPNLGHGQDAFFDVTGFVAATHAPYLAFNLRSSGTDVFSSLEYNQGHAAQLLVSSVPEPSQPAMLAAGLLAMKLLLRRRNR